VARANFKEGGHATRVNGFGTIFYRGSPRPNLNLWVRRGNPWGHLGFSEKAGDKKTKDLWNQRKGL